MKRFLAFAILLCLCVSTAFADFDEKLLIQYNATANVLGAQKLDSKTATYQNDTWLFENDYYYVGFEMSPLGGIRTGAVYAKDENHLDEFLCASFAMMTFLGKMDYQAAGMLLYQFTRVKADKDSSPFTIGMDAFQIIPTSQFKYSMVYMNNDGKVSE